MFFIAKKYLKDTTLGEEADNPDRPPVILSKGQYGYIDLKNRSINVDDLAVENNFAWKSGRFHFEELTIEQVCIQLNRIYSIDCFFKESDIRSLNLTAIFTNESLEKTLDVIFMTLEVRYELRDGDVNWSM